MSLRSDLKEAMAVALEKLGYTFEAERVREERWTRIGGLVTAQAALSVCDEYEEVEMQEANSAGNYWRSPDTFYWEPQKPSFTVYRKKQKPEPTLLEAAKMANHILNQLSAPYKNDALEETRTTLTAAIAKEEAQL